MITTKNKQNKAICTHTQENLTQHSKKETEIQLELFSYFFFLEYFHQKLLRMSSLVKAAPLL